MTLTRKHFMDLMQKAHRNMIQSSSFRLMRSTPGHATYGVWVNGGKCGDLVVRQDEREAFEAMMQQGGFAFLEAAQDAGR